MDNTLMDMRDQMLLSTVIKSSCQQLKSSKQGHENGVAMARKKKHHHKGAGVLSFGMFDSHSHYSCEGPRPIP